MSEADEQFFVGAQTVVITLLQTTQIISEVCCIKPKSYESRRNSFFFLFFFSFLSGVDAPHAYVRAWALGCFYSHISTRTFRRWTAARRLKECPSVS